MRHTPLHGSHLALGAKMIPFGGWDMPVFYSGINAEHRAVRNAAGIFDIGHMGILKVSGEDAIPFLQGILTNDINKLGVNSSHYSLILNDNGGVIDDIFIYRLADYYLLVLNASNAEKDIKWLNEHLKGKAALVDLKDSLTLIALQGPKAQGILQKLCDTDLGMIGHHKISEIKLSGISALASRTGYTGEDGFELFVHPLKAEKLWNDLVALGALPCGLGARDTLRLEAGMPLYGHEYNEGITPLETPFMFAVKLDKGSFVGSEKLLEQKKNGIAQKLIGIKLVEQGVPRQGYKIFKDGKLIGYVASGTMSPTLGFALGMGYIRQEFSSPGEIIAIEIRDKMVAAEVVKLPFYKRTSI